MRPGASPEAHDDVDSVLLTAEVDVRVRSRSWLHAGRSRLVRVRLFQVAGLESKQLRPPTRLVALPAHPSCGKAEALPGLQRCLCLDNASAVALLPSPSHRPRLCVENALR
jgi:hypothetical protein